MFDPQREQFRIILAYLPKKDKRVNEKSPPLRKIFLGKARSHGAAALFALPCAQGNFLDRRNAHRIQDDDPEQRGKISCGERNEIDGGTDGREGQCGQENRTAGRQQTDGKGGAVLPGERVRAQKMERKELREGGFHKPARAEERRECRLPLLSERGIARSARRGTDGKV